MPDLFDELITERKKSSIPQKIGKTASQFGKSAATGLTGTYGDVLSLVGLSPEQTLTPGQKSLYEAEFEAPESTLPFLQDEDILPRYNRFPRSEEVGELIGENNPESLPERYAQRIGRSVGSGAALGGGTKVLTTLGRASAIGQSAKELGAPESVATTLELLSLFGPDALAKQAYGPKKLKDFIDYARKRGLTEEEIAGLVKGDRQAKALSKLAKKSGKTENLLQSIDTKAGSAFDSVKNAAKKMGPLEAETSAELGDKFFDILKDLYQTVKASPDKQSAINFIEESYQNLMNRGSSPEQLINFWQDINSATNWNAIKNGKKILGRLKDPIKETLIKASPELAQEFELANTLYSRSKSLAKGLKPKTIDNILDKGPLGAAMLSVALGNPGIMSKYMATSVIRELSRQMIFNPRIQNIPKKMLEAIKNDKVKTAQSLLKVFKKEVQKESPDIFDNVAVSELF